MFIITTTIRCLGYAIAVALSRETAVISEIAAITWDY